jgi:hypothetical protein
VYFWVDGIYFQPRIDHDKECLFVIIGADEINFSSAHRSSGLKTIGAARRAMVSS